MLPDGAVLENIDPSKTEKVKVIALRGDDFLKQLSQEEIDAHKICGRIRSTCQGGSGKRCAVAGCRSRQDAAHGKISS